MELKEAIYNRRSIRRFKKKAVDRELISEIIRGASFAPSACNLQPWEFVIVDDSQTLELLSKTATDKLKNISTCVFVLYYSNYTRNRHSHLQGVSAAVQNFLLLSYEAGLGACWITGFKNDDQIKRILKIPEPYVIAALILVGHPEGDSKPPYRSDLKDIAHFNSFEQKRPLFPISLNPKDWTVKELKEYRERICGVYNSRFLLEPGIKNESKDIVKIIGLYIEKNSAILDLVTYGGNFLNELCKNFENITGCDFVESQLDFLRCSFEGVTFKNMKELHTVSNQVECVTIIGKIESYPEPNELIELSYNALKSQGYVVLFFTNKYSLANFVFWLASKIGVIKDSYHGNPYLTLGPHRACSKNTLKNLLKNSGFQIKDIYKINNQRLFKRLMKKGASQIPFWRKGMQLLAFISRLDSMLGKFFPEHYLIVAKKR